MTRRVARHAHDDPPPRRDAPAPSGAVLAGYRLVRRLATGDRADLHLAVVDEPRTGGAEAPAAPPSLVVVRVYGTDADATAIAVEIDAMERDATGTTPTLVDVARLPDGRVCVVVERVGTHSLGGILDAGPISAGQAVTALAPVVVAVRELSRAGFAHTRLSPADVLVDATGRPRLVGLGALERVGAETPMAERRDRSRRAHAALLDLVTVVASATGAASRFAPVVELVREPLERRPFAPDHVAIERALFAVADPTPLLPAPLVPHVDSVPSRVGGRPDRERVVPSVPAASAVPSGRDLGRTLAELAQVPGELVDRLGETADSGPTAAVRRRAAAWAGRRRPVLAVGTLVGAAVLVMLLTAVPPSGRAEPDGSAAPAPSSSAPPATGPWSGGDEPATESAPTGASTDPERAAADPEAPAAVAAMLLEIRAGCLAARDVACIGAYAQDGSPLAVRDRAAMDSDAAPEEPIVGLDGITVAGELGDAVVLAVPTAAGREPASLLMMRSEAGWRLREWFD
ncbi:hypothetical protein GCM10009819_02210 [Agromyces tropicus]|uniref:Protein kinase domain-containing protein n=1 Tax=Agromyces tropicus TaxID=555371 RepID=A0ABP5FBS3_9MICO